MRYLGLLLLTAASSWGCSCMSLASPCSEVGGSSVIFVARVLTDSGDGWGKGPAHVAIEEALQNVPADLREADIETAAGTSCYFRLKAGERYVIITQGSRYSVAACSSSFRLSGSEHILDAMRNQVKGGPARLVGTVVKRTGAYSRNGGIPGVAVTLEAGGKKREAMTDGFGHYSFPGLDPAQYRIQLSKGGYRQDEDYTQEWSSHLILRPAQQPELGTVLISKSSCSIWDLGMWPDGRVRGKIRNLDGNPLRGVVVQAFALDAKNERDSSPLRQATTAADGSYTIGALPPGSYAIGVNGEKYRDADVYPPTYYGGGKAIYLEESGSAAGIDITVPRARVAAQLRVILVRQDGTPYAGANVSLDSLEGRQRWYTREESSAKGEISVPAYVGERYSVRASDYTTNPATRTLIHFEGATKIEVTDPNPSVVVVLHEIN